MCFRVGSIRVACIYAVVFRRTLLTLTIYLRVWIGSVIFLVKPESFLVLLFLFSHAFCARYFNSVLFFEWFVLCVEKKKKHEEK